MAFELINDKGDSLLKSDHQIDGMKPAFSSESFDLDLPFGNVRSTQWTFDGIKAISTDSRFRAPTVFDWKGDNEVITMHFNLLGTISMFDPRLNRPFVLSANRHNLFYGKEAGGKIQTDDLHTNTFLIQFSKDAFFRIAENGNEAIKRFAGHVDAGRSAALSDTNLDIDFRIQSCINAMLHCQFNDQLKGLFYLSKAIELLVLQAETFDSALQPYPRHLKGEYDRERIIFAKDYLLEHIQNPPSLKELSKVAGMNEFKLKKGFKEIFNRTAFEYLSDVRLERAKQDLMERNKTATQIADELGYSSLHHFSNAFKKKFNVPPTKILKK
ncbi:AraC family transcriptional regulator [Chitinophaga lutea]|uniref:AraC family transcriptional regulator n=1 Tax=Chitinophaga lutea TaxID=2488634 RepID=A0A3N4PZ25_9BACT|nr:AraC family transcriptional regulator [Chitinophaga lutea]RPE08940.1 AraC family transcriptional regulator [Chitinophaga lutea]